MLNKAFVPSPYSLPGIRHDYLLKMPSQKTKTKIDYCWIAPEELNEALHMLKRMPRQGYKSV